MDATSRSSPRSLPPSPPALSHKKLTGADALLPERLLITTHGFVDLPSTVAAVVAACASASQSVDCKNLVLSAVVTCVDAPRALEKWAAHGDERCAPGLIECLDDGFVQGVIVCHSNEAPAKRARAPQAASSPS